MLVGSLLLSRPLPFPFIYPPNLRVRPSAMQRLAPQKVFRTRPVLYGICYCPLRHASPDPPPARRLARVIDYPRVVSPEAIETGHALTGGLVVP